MAKMHDQDFAKKVPVFLGGFWGLIANPRKLKARCGLDFDCHSAISNKVWFCHDNHIV